MLDTDIGIEHPSIRASCIRPCESPASTTARCASASRLADTEVGIAGPFENYTRRTPALDAEYFATLAKEERIGRFVVGLPVHLHGGESQKSTEARAFGEWLGEVTGVPVEYFDERFTTSEADEFWARPKLTKKQRQARRDQLAAQIMLTAYLEAGGRGQTIRPSRSIEPNPHGSTIREMTKLIFGCGYLGERVARRWRDGGRRSCRRHAQRRASRRISSSRVTTRSSPTSRGRKR